MGQINFAKSTVHRWKLTVAVIALTLVFLFAGFSGPVILHRSPRWKMAVAHIVLFQFKSSASPEEIKDVCTYTAP
jgi:hypothetical protein